MEYAFLPVALNIMLSIELVKLVIHLVVLVLDLSILIVFLVLNRDILFIKIFATPNVLLKLIIIPKSVINVILNALNVILIPDIAVLVVIQDFFYTSQHAFKIAQKILLKTQLPAKTVILAV
jgi:hypothetical protein